MEHRTRTGYAPQRCIAVAAGFVSIAFCACTGAQTSPGAARLRTESPSQATVDDVRRADVDAADVPSADREPPSDAPPTVARAPFRPLAAWAFPGAADVARWRRPASLGRTGRFDGLSRVRAVSDHAGLLLIDSWDQTQVFAPGTTTARATREGIGGWLYAGGLVVLGGAHGRGVVALDASDLSEVWRSSIGAAAGGRIVSAAYTRGVLVCSVLRPPGGERVAFDAGTGRVLWNETLEGNRTIHDELGTVGDILVTPSVSVDPWIQGRDPTTGRVLWRVSVGADLFRNFRLADDGRHLAVSVDDDETGRARVVVVEGSSGREVLRRSFNGSGAAPGVAIRGDELYALVPATAGAGVSSVRVVRVGLASGRNVWTSPALSGSLGELPTRLVVDGDAVYAFAREILYALARGTGRIAWRRGLESGSVVSFARPVERGPATLYVTADGRLAEFERGGRADAERVVVLSGVVTLNGVPVAGANVRAGPTHVRTGANGRYRLTIRGRGIVNVTVEYLPPRGLEAAGGIEIDLDTSPPRRTEELPLAQYEPGL